MGGDVLAVAHTTAADDGSTGSALAGQPARKWTGTNSRHVAVVHLYRCCATARGAQPSVGPSPRSIRLDRADGAHQLHATGDPARYHFLELCAWLGDRAVGSAPGRAGPVRDRG